MELIHCNDDNCYSSSENLQSLFEELVIRPYEEHIVIPFDDNPPYPSEILDHGRTNFDESTLYLGRSYSPEDKVTLYCCNYMPMHLYSSYHLYSTPLIPRVECKNILFIDVGCGPFTSGIAFWAATRQSNITYIGIDSSQTMLNKAQEINQYGPDNYREPFYENFHLIRDYNQLPELLDSIKMGNPDNTLTIFNFCYFFQSRTLDIENLAEVVCDADVGGYTCMVYQDPVRPKFQRNWHTFKFRVIPYHSVFDASGFGCENPTQVMDVKCENLRIFPQQPTHKVTVSYDSFNNFSWRKKSLSR